MNRGRVVRLSPFAVLLCCSVAHSAAAPGRTPGRDGTGPNDNAPQQQIRKTEAKLQAEIESLEEKLRAHIDEVEAELRQDAFSYVQWQSGLFSILMTILVLLAASAYGLGAFFSRASVRRRLRKLKKDSDEALATIEGSSAQILRTAYDGAHDTVQAYYVCCDVLGVVEHPVTDAALHRAKARWARLQVSVGLEMDQLIAGANSLAYLGTPKEDVKRLQLAGERPDLSQDAREAISNAIRRLEQRAEQDDSSKSKESGDSTTRESEDEA